MMNFTATLQERATLKKTIASLEAEIATTLPRELAGLPQAYGFESVESFVKAVQLASRNKPKRRGRPPGTGKRVASSKKTATPRRRRQGKISDAMKADLRKRVESGQTGAAIAKALKISLASVHNVKKELGLIRG